MTFQTFTPTAPSKSEKKWYIIDAQGKTLGKIATHIVVLLRGKNKPQFVPHLDMGDYVVVINADQIRVTGKKEEQKKYYRHSGYLGHLKTQSLGTMRREHPERILFKAVSGMIPRNRLRRPVLSKLFIYAGATHPHAGQNPSTVSF